MSGLETPQMLSETAAFTMKMIVSVPAAQLAPQLIQIFCHIQHELTDGLVNKAGANIFFGQMNMAVSVTYERKWALPEER